MPRSSSRKRSSGRKRKSSKSSRRSRKTKVSKSVSLSDTHHFKETVNGGVLGISSTTALGGGVFIMQLTDFPIFQKFSTCFEFARLNKCTIHFIPKFNMQLNQLTFSTGVEATVSINGTIITAVDQVPYDVVIGSSTVAATWSNDSSNTTGTSSPTAYTSNIITPGYIRGLQGSKEMEIYKKRSISFMPCFFDYIMDGQGLGDTDNPAFERKVKKWVATKYVGAGSGTVDVTPGHGPVYYGPVYCFDVNAPPSSGSQALYDIRFTYSMSFKRVTGV